MEFQPTRRHKLHPAGLGVAALLVLLLATSLVWAAPDGITAQRLAQKATATPAAPAAEATPSTVSGAVFGGLLIGNNAQQGGVTLGSGGNAASTDDIPVLGADITQPWEASPVITPGMVVRNTIDNADWGWSYAIDAVANQEYTVRMESDGSGDLDSFLALVDSSETILLQDDDGGGERNAQMIFTLPAAGRYYLVATRYNTDTGQTSGGFLLSFFESATGSGGTITPASATSVQVMGGGVDEPWTAAPLITPGMVVGNTIDNTNWAWSYAIDGRAGQTLTIRMESDGSGDLDCFLALVDSSETILFQDDDGGGGTNSQLTYTLPAAGRYYIVATRYNADTGQTSGGFVLSYFEGGSAPATGGTQQTTAPAAGTLDYTLTPTFGSVDLISGFAEDPYAIDLVAGGDVNAASALGGACTGQAAGFVAQAPDFRLNYTSASYALRVFFTGNGDTTLVINAPDGLWYCDDDSGGSGHPLINFGSPLTGQYDIWVGSFQSGQFVEGTLTITERDLMPGASTSKAGGGLIDNWK